jgi:glycosyltransferase involved in cell wall biosynthesis
VATLRFARARGSEAAWSKFLQAPYIVREARRAGVEHLHAHFASGPARQAKLAHMLSGIPFSFTGHAKDLFWTGHQHGKNNKLKKRVREASFVITISDYNREFIRSLGFRVPRRGLHTLPNGMDLSQWTYERPDGLPTRREAGTPPLFLAVGRLVEKKGFADLVEACRLLKAQGRPFRCLIAGDGPERERLAAQIAASELEDRVTLAGAIALEVLRKEHMPRATLLVQPSVVCDDGDQDGIPTVLIEAMATGLPVISTPVSGIGEAVRHGATGLLVGQRKPAALAATMDMLANDPQMAARLATGARRLVEMRFDLRNNVGILIHLYRHSARGELRWSEAKLRERLGLGPLDPLAVEEAEFDVAAEG